MDPQDPQASAVVTSQMSGSHNKNVVVVGNYNNVSLENKQGLRLSHLHKLAGAGSTAALQLTAFERRTRFIGRSSEFEALKEWLSAPSLISVRTIIGAPGIGKTRLAIELADFAEAQGWTSGFLRASELHRFVNAPCLSDWVWNRPTLIVIDYAAQKADSLATLMESLQDYGQAGLPEDRSKLRLLLLERDASLQFGWWPKVFGPAGHSDRRIDLAEPRHPSALSPLIRDHALAIANDVIAHHAARSDAAQVLNELAKAEGTRWMIGNPLFTQIAVLSAGEGGQSDKFSMNGLLDGVVERERKLMEDKWRSAKLSVPFFKEFAKLVAAITLLQGATLQALNDLLNDVASFARLASFVPKDKIVELLSSTLFFDDVSGYRALEPDIVGDHFIVCSEVDADLILSVFKLDRFSVSPRLWRMLTQYENDQELSARVTKWFREILVHLSSDTLILDVFVSDAPRDISGRTAELIAEARSHITDGLRRGGNTQEKLLTRRDQQQNLVAYALLREGNALAQAGKRHEALAKFDEAMSDLEAKNVSTEDEIWYKLIAFSADNYEAVGKIDEFLAALDHLIAIATKLVEDGRSNEASFLSDDLKKILNHEHMYMRPRGLKFVLRVGIPDQRLKLAQFILKRATGSVSLTLVLAAVDHLEHLAQSGVYEHLQNDASFLEQAAIRLERKGAADFAKVLCEAQQRFRSDAHQFIVDLLNFELQLRGLAINSKPEQSAEFKIDHVKKCLERLRWFLELGGHLDMGHFFQMSINIASGLPSASAEVATTALKLASADDQSNRLQLGLHLSKAICDIAHDLGVVLQQNCKEALMVAASRMPE